MKAKAGKWMKPALFTLGGALVGLGYYLVAGCPTGSCIITSSPFTSMAYMGRRRGGGPHGRGVSGRRCLI